MTQDWQQNEDFILISFTLKLGNNHDWKITVYNNTKSYSKGNQNEELRLNMLNKNAVQKIRPENKNSAATFRLQA